MIRFTLRRSVANFQCSSLLYYIRPRLLPRKSARLQLLKHPKNLKFSSSQFSLKISVWSLVRRQFVSHLLKNSFYNFSLYISLLLICVWGAFLGGGMGCGREVRGGEKRECNPRLSARISGFPYFPLTTMKIVITAMKFRNCEPRRRSSRVSSP